MNFIHIVFIILALMIISLLSTAYYVNEIKSKECVCIETNCSNIKSK